MTIKEELAQEIESTPEPLLEETLNYLRHLKAAQSRSEAQPASQSVPKQPSLKESTGQALLDHLKTLETWQGDDFEDCLASVYATRSKAKFDDLNPFE
jgi:hypothetical protein